jgi:hypothetical protein
LVVLPTPWNNPPARPLDLLHQLVSGERGGVHGRLVEPEVGDHRPQVGVGWQIDLRQAGDTGADQQTMPITGDFLCQSCVFVAPPNHHLLVSGDGRLKLSSSTSEKVHHARPSAEPLFASVADVYKKNAIAVVLTGGDGDGSIGVQIIKEKGGKVIAQDRPTSQDFSMPETSIKTGDVDFILPLNEIAPKLIELVGAGKG